MPNIENLEEVITALVVSFVGTGTFAMIAKIALNRIYKTIKENLKKAEDENRINSETSTKLAKHVDASEKRMMERLDEVNKKFSDMDSGLRELIADFEKRDRQLAEIIEESMGEDDDKKD